MVVSGEARGEPFYGQVAVAAVVMNRATHNKDSICHEAFKPKQFAPRKHPTPSSYVASYVAYYLYDYLPEKLRSNWYFSSGNGRKHYGKYNMTIKHHRFYTQ